MQKPAETPVPLHSVIRDRWSPVAFSARPIEPAVFGSLFEAARWTASSYNEQPWVFCVATQEQPTEFTQLLSCLMEANRVWVQHAYALAVTCAAKTYARNQKPNKHAWHDTGAALNSLVLQAMSHGIYCHPMGGFDSVAVRTVMQIPESHEPVTAVAIGYPADDLSKVDDALRQRDASPRVRKPLTDMVFTGRWGKFAGPFW
jgi:nitroreductase